MNKFSLELNQPDHKINLAKAALLYARDEYPNLEMGKYLNQLETMAQEIKERLHKISYPLKVIKTINKYLFEELGFKGNKDDYYDPRNSYLNEVIERRTGIPITLSVVYLDIAKRLDFPMAGVAIPGHFMIRPDFEDVGIFVDVFNQGEILFEQDCEAKLKEIYQQNINLEPHFLEPISNQQMLGQMLTNLKYIYLNSQEYGKMLRIIELILLIFPNHPIEIRDRGLLYYQLQEWQKAIHDLQLYLTMLPTAQDRDAIRQLLQKIE